MDPRPPRPPRRGFLGRLPYIGLVSHEPDKPPLPGMAAIGVGVLLLGLAIALRVLV